MWKTCFICWVSSYCCFLLSAFKGIENLLISNVSIQNGRSQDLIINCKDSYIYIRGVNFLSIKNAFVQLKENVFDKKLLLKEIKFAMNYKKKIDRQIHISSLAKQNGKLMLQYACANVSTDCGNECNYPGSTCIPSLKKSDCMCLQVPDKTMTKMFCSGASYKGCYNTIDHPHDIVLNVSSLLKPNLCIQFCQMLGYTYAGIAGLNGGCRCYKDGINFTKPIDEENCLSPCQSESEYSCGKFPNTHIFATGYQRKASACQFPDVCPNGTFCMSTFDGHFCLCNFSSVDRAAGCYGCLPGWFTTPTSKDCYLVTDLTKLPEQKDEFCADFYGKEVEISTIKDLTLLLRVVVESVVKEDTRSEIEETILKDHDMDTLSQAKLPLCERPKSVVTGKFPWTNWPEGTYGLPMPITGCPDKKDVWKDGFHEQDTENTDNSNHISHPLHLQGKFNNDSIRQSFCMKLNNTGSGTWPRGRYCIYKKGKCPSHLLEGMIYWDDEDDENQNIKDDDGALPDGIFKADTQIEFCCSTDPIKEKGIILPRDRPFYLFPYKEKRCQPIIGTRSSLEFVEWDMENDYLNITLAVAFKMNIPYSEITRVRKNLVVYYCYYEPIPSCGLPFCNSHISFNQSTFPVGQVINYSCEKGYQNIGDSKDICLPSEFWSSIKGAQCVDIDECRSGHDCHVKANCYNTKGSYYCLCNPGWTGDGRTCTAVRCNQPPTVDNGKLLSPTTFQGDWYSEGSKIILTCLHGFVLIGSNVSRCMKDGKWSEPPICIENSKCVSDTYECITHHDSLIGNFEMCQCEKIGDINNNTVSGRNQQKDLTTIKIIITVVVSLVAMFIVIILIVVILLRFRKKEQEKHKQNMRKSQSTSSIYADINEFRLDVKFNKFRKESGVSSQTIISESKYSTAPPHLPPRTSMTSTDSSSPETRTNLLQKPDVSLLRRRSDFNNSDSLLGVHKPFSTIFEQEPLHQKFSDANDRSLTQFKLNSITQRRSSEQRFNNGSFPWNNNTSASSLTNQNSLTNFYVGDKPMISEDDEYDQSERKSVLENPYIDVNNASDMSDDEASSISQSEPNHAEYDMLPKNTINIKMRHRSYTDFPVAKTKEKVQKADENFDKKLQRSISLPGTKFSDQIEAEDNGIYKAVKRKATHQLSNSSDEVFFDFHAKSSKESPRKRKKAISKFSLRLNLMSYKRSSTKNKIRQSSPIFSDLSSRLFKYLSHKNDDVEVRQRRSETVSF